MKRVKFSRVRGSMRTSTVHYQKSLLGGRKNRRGGEGKGKNANGNREPFYFPPPTPFGAYYES